MPKRQHGKCGSDFRTIGLCWLLRGLGRRSELSILNNNSNGPTECNRTGRKQLDNLEQTLQAKPVSSHTCLAFTTYNISTFIRDIEHNIALLRKGPKDTWSV